MSGLFVYVLCTNSTRINFLPSQVSRLGRPKTQLTLKAAASVLLPTDRDAPLDPPTRRSRTRRRRPRSTETIGRQTAPFWTGAESIFFLRGDSGGFLWILDIDSGESARRPRRKSRSSGASRRKRRANDSLSRFFVRGAGPWTWRRGSDSQRRRQREARRVAMVVRSCRLVKEETIVVVVVRGRDHCCSASSSSPREQ